MAIMMLAAALLTSGSLDPSVLSVEQKVGQLLVVSAAATGRDADLESLLDQISRYQVGGILWMKGDPFIQLDWIARCQAVAEIPLLMMQDLEWGARMRFEVGTDLPRAPEMGSFSLSQIQAVGYAIGLQAQAVGIHLNLAPVVDLSCDPQAFITPRCFSADAGQVANSAQAYLQGLARAGVLGCAKHFPGHGAVLQDTHKGEATILVDLARHLEPFSALIRVGVSVVMVGHLGVDGVPASLSSEAVSVLLRKRLGFQGVVITDALDMEGVISNRTHAEIALGAILAGCDWLLAPPNLALAYSTLLGVDEARLDASVARIFDLKAHARNQSGLLEIPDAVYSPS